MSQISRSTTRKFLYQYLFAKTYGEVDFDNFKESFFSWVFEAELDLEYFNEMIEVIEKNNRWILAIISKYAPKFKIWDMELSNILPIIIWTSEMIFLKEEIPVKVIMNESVNLAKLYWDESSWKMVNWVLYTIVNSLEDSKKFILENNNSLYTIFD